MKCWASVICILLAVCLPGFAQVIDPIIGPMVRIISPPNHAVFFSPVDIPIFAFVVDSPNTTNVEFYANSNDLGHGFSLGASTRPPGIATPAVDLTGTPIARLDSVYCLVWTNVQPGSYALTAVTKGTDLVLDPLGDGFISRTSAPVNITVLPRNIVSNGPAVVSIVATDPIAVVGTNSWIWHVPPTAVPTWSNWPPPVTAPCTNWGPKDALFTVRRFGGETNTVTVTYSIGGTASNGVDYVKLPGSVTISNNTAYGLIPIIPIDNGAPYVPKTVILTLTSNDSEYVIGVPKRATAVILHDWLRPLPLLLPDGSFHLNAAGPDGAWFNLMGSADLLHWSPVCTNQVVEGSIDFVDGNVAGNVLQYYQAVPQAAAPSQ